MLQKLAQIAYQLDCCGQSHLADQIDDLISMAADNTDEQIRRELRNQRPAGIGTHPDSDLKGSESPVSRIEYEIATRHQIELDKQHLLQDVVVMIEAQVGPIQHKSDKSFSLAHPHISFEFDRSKCTLALEMIAPTSFMLKADFHSPGLSNETQEFPLSLSKPVGEAWANTVAQAISAKLLERS